MADRLYDYLIVGGGIAGVTAAETIRARDAKASVAILSAEAHPLYSRVLLPAYLKGTIARERVFLRTADAYASKKIDFYPGARVVAVDLSRREVTAADGRVFDFGQLLVAAGGRVRPWTHQDAAMPDIYRLQTIDDADRLILAMSRIREPLVVGASFIALEFVEIFLRHGIVPRVVVDAPGFFSGFLDAAGSAILEENLRRRGVSCLFGSSIEAVRRRGAFYEVAAGGTVLRADAFALGIGIDRNTPFLEGLGIIQGGRGVEADEYLRTGASGVWAAGDAADYYDVISGTRRAAGNWTHALLQGSRAGLNMTGAPEPFVHVPSYSITNCGMQIAAIGTCAGEGITAITRTGAPAAEYERLFVRDGVIMGAFLINCLRDRPALTDMIAHRMDIRRFMDRLGDMAFDISAALRVK